MRAIIFVAGLFIFGLVSLANAGFTLYERWDLQANGQPARMELVDPKSPVQEATGVTSYEFARIRYTPTGGEPVVTQRPIPKSIGVQLRTSAPIAVVVLHDPDRIVYNGETPQVPWAWLVVSVASFATFAYALKLIKRRW